MATTNPATPQWNELISGVFALNSESFQRLMNQPHGLAIALVVVFLAGLSLAIGQSIVLFINRVKPGRFVFSLVLNAVLFTAGFLVLAFSTWLIGLAPWSTYLPLLKLVTVLGLGYAPFLFSFLGALPYLGYPIATLLSVWNLLALVVGFAAIAQVGISVAFGYVAVGWGIKQLLEGSIGQPIARFSRSLFDRVAGVEVTHTYADLKAMVLAGTRPATPIVQASPSVLPDVQQFLQASGRHPSSPPPRPEQPVTTPFISTAAFSVSPSPPSLPALDSDDRLRLPQWLYLGWSWLILAIGFSITLLFLRPIRHGLFSWYDSIPFLFQFVFDLIWIGVVAIVFAGILAPLESLGWWAGWYDDELDTVRSEKAESVPRAATPIPPLAHPLTQPQPEIDRYLVYLDGIGQSGEAYTPDVETFLSALRPVLPAQVELVQGLMMYSVLNKPLGEDRPLALLWRLADRVRWRNPAALLGLLVNLRNVIIVAVSSDKRYGPIYNQGIAKVVVDGLLARGYQPGSGIPITLLGYSGGGEMAVACAPYLKRAIGAPIDVISLGGVMSANNNLLKLEHLYHIVGAKDTVERLGPILFPGRWPIFPLSYWNRARRKGKITRFAAGAVGHQVPGGYMDPQAILADGQTHLQQTIAMILQILQGEALRADQGLPRKTSNYARYQALAFNRPDYYPIAQPVDSTHYRPIGDWMGRLILPRREERSQVRGVWFEIHHAPTAYRSWIGRIVKLRWTTDPVIRAVVKAVVKDVHFSAEAEFSSQYGGLIHPHRLNHWQQVGPLESLAGSRPLDDMIVKLRDPVEVGEDILFIHSPPIEITGRFYALVQFVEPVVGTDQFRVSHFDRATRQFTGPADVMRLPAVHLAEDYGSYPSTTRDLERSPFNETGWYVYGAFDAEGNFVVQSLAPRALLRLQPDRVMFDRKTAYHYIRHQTWNQIRTQKGTIASVLCTGRGTDESDAIQAAIDEWQVGDQALVLHTYGGIGGANKEPAAASPIFFGHFAYGLADVIHEPLANERRFEICYHQVYTHNTDGLVAGALHWSRYMGDRQFGWLGTRPTCDLIVKLDAFTNPYTLEDRSLSPLTIMMRQLQVMTARYRIGDGTGGTYVGPANNCSQDSNQALFASLDRMARRLQDNPALYQALQADASQNQRFQILRSLSTDLQRKLQPLGRLRSDWEQNEYNLGSTLEDQPWRNLWIGLGSWRTMLPRLASDTIVHSFLKHGASVWVLRTNQIGGSDPDIEPIAPLTL